ncbi:MAG: LysR family transcriptional regulator [Albidovulum sp.]
MPCITFLALQEHILDLNWLRDFECLARTLNFTRASDARNITQSAFSRRIKALESWVGLPLVNRATYPVQLTEAGRQFLPVALAAIAQLSESRQSIRDADRGDSRFVRFSALHTISVNFLAPRLERLQSEIPDLHTRVISDSLSTCCELLVEGAVDIMLCYYHHAVSPMIDEAAFARKDLLTDRLIPVAATGPARAMGWDLAKQGGAPIPYLAYESTSFLGMVVENTIGRKPLDAETIYVDSLVETIKRRLMIGGGFAWMPETAISAELAAGLVVPVGNHEWCTELTISALSNTAIFDQTAGAVWGSL